MENSDTYGDHTYLIYLFIFCVFQPLMFITLTDLLPYYLVFERISSVLRIFENLPQDLDSNNQGSTERSSESSIISDQTQPSSGPETANMHSGTTSQRLTDIREAGDQADRPVQLEEMNVRRLRSGRVYDLQPLNSQQNANRSAIKSKKPTPTTDKPRKMIQRCLKNWFGDNYRLAREERVPEDIERYARPLSYVVRFFNLVENNPMTQE